MTSLDYRKFIREFEPVYKRYCLKQFRNVLTATEIYRYILRKGNRLRPYLIQLTYHGSITSKKNNDNVLLSLQCSYELLHTYAKLSDDLVDFYIPQNRLTNKELSRRILLADICLLKANQGFFSLPSSSLQLLQKSWLEMQDRTWSGQYNEIFGQVKDLQSITHIAINKSALYTFSYPFSLGAQLGRDNNLSKKLFALGKKLGLAYQIQNDIRSFNNREVISEDLINYRLNIVTYTACQHNPLVKQAFSSQKKTSKKDLRVLGKLIASNENLEIVKNKAREIINSARRDIINLPIRPEVKGELVAHIHRIFYEFQSEK